MTIHARDMGTYIVQYGTNADRLALVAGNIQPLTEFHETDTGVEYKWFDSWVNKATLALPVTISSLLFPSSTGNNSVAQLASAISFVGTIETVLSLQSAQVMIRCDTAYSYTIDSFEDAAGLQPCGSFTHWKTAGDPTNANYILPGNYYRLTVKNLGGSTTTTLAIAVTFGIMPSTDDSGSAIVSEPSVYGAVAMTVGAAAIKEGRQLFVNCSVPGNVAVTFADTSTLVTPVSVGANIFPWAVTKINTSGTTATATYANLK